MVALLVPVQYLTGGSIERTHHAVHMGMTPAYWDVVQHHLHNYSGMAIGLLMGVRLVFRLLQTAETRAPGTWAGRAATALHHAFYAAILAQACMGFVASYLWFGTAPLPRRRIEDHSGDGGAAFRSGDLAHGGRPRRDGRPDGVPASDALSR
ncbi:hypothetical protein Rleg_7167 (plasmid) [Rhizobium leguminosarum bv. trifolii WSM1325]|uniref:Cytochrome b561 bacterial/Ni-hydrogenase domain-containing protein n=1 Tax=Rhizobium leguminosarum bv. trifolii (strain WSM1325) TaxID=395491 RepID=C6B7W7_RHILS|nr:hypothetical protein Rleg_7167 [Rhizobium leguminosarum bv. trifolii WSM1325]